MYFSKSITEISFMVIHFIMMIAIMIHIANDELRMKVSKLSI